MKRSSEDRLRLQSNSCKLDVAQVFVNIIYFIDRDRVFLESLNAFVETRICALICMLNLLQSVHIFLIVVQFCTVCCALEEILNVDDIYDCHRLDDCRAR